MKKIFKSFIVLFVFCLTLSFGGFFVNITPSYAEETNAGEPVTIATSQNLEDYINNFNSQNQNDHIILTADIDMSTVILTKTLGTADIPFKGIFDGKGHEISNLNIDVRKNMTDDTSLDNLQCAGLFGSTLGATIKNLSVLGTQSISIGGYQIVEVTTPGSMEITQEQVEVAGCIDAYVGGIVGYAQSTTFVNVQANSNLTCVGVGQCNLEMGNLAGCAVANTTIDNVIIRPTTGFGRIAIENNNNNISIGGLVGRLSSSKIKFAVVQAQYNINISNSFEGKMNVGGIVGRIEQSNSEIINVACENAFSITNNSSASVYIGEIVGVIKNPAPAVGNIANIKFKTNSGINRFGTMGSYDYNDPSYYDMILPTEQNLNDLEKNDGTAPAYFENIEGKTWHTRYGGWDFVNTWYVDARAIKLQAFNKNFSISFEENDIIKLETDLNSLSYGYQDEVKLEFSFKNGLNKFFTLTGLSLANKFNITNTTEIDVKNENYYILNSPYFSILSKKINIEDSQNQMVEVDGLELTIKNVNMSNVGKISFNYQQKYFKMKASTRLYDGTNGERLEGEPGFVFLSSNSVTDTPTLEESVYYGQTFDVETRVKPDNTVNTFVGWHLLTKDSSGQETLTPLYQEGDQTNPILKVTFGENLFVEDFEIVAKYINDACLMSLILDDGISKIEIASNVVVLETTNAGEEVAVSKTESSLKLEIFVKNGYVFDVETFIKDNAIYKAGDSDINIFTQSEMKELDDGGKSYLFLLNMTLLTDEYNDSMTIKTTTYLAKDNNNSWIWWTVGGVVGGVVLIGLIILIVVLARRGGGYGGGKVKFGRKNFKNMYY